MLGSQLQKFFGLAVVSSILTLLFSAAPTIAGDRDCSAPTSEDSAVTATQCLFILNAAVGNVTCPGSACACDPSGNGMVTAADALICLNIAVGGAVPLTCPAPCTGAPLVCDSFSLAVAAGSRFDMGWKGPGHGGHYIEGSTLTVDVLRRCSDNDATCTDDSDCETGTCRATCDCVEDTQCEVSGPTGPSKCITNSAIDCDTNADCESYGGQCVHFFGPPLPLAASGVPTCIEQYFSGPVTGTLDTATGHVAINATLRKRTWLGINIETPCPLCESLDGATPTCSGGINQGQSCEVDIVDPQWGPLSGDCPAFFHTGSSGIGLNVRYQPLTTHPIVQTAKLPCGFPFDGLHPSTGNGACLNDFSSCQTNDDCIGATCGLYCHCGFCDDGQGGGPDPALACFADADCPQGSFCSSDPEASNLSQAQPNGCQSVVCGEATPDGCCVAGDPECATPTERDGICDSNPLDCSTNAECVESGNGVECLLSPRRCFGPDIARSGTPSPLAGYCSEESEAIGCSSNSDCEVGACVPQTARPIAAAAACIPATASSALNSAAGTPGPAALTLPLQLTACGCGDGITGCAEECDDGNQVSGDGCSSSCRLEASLDRR